MEPPTLHRQHVGLPLSCPPSMQTTQPCPHGLCSQEPHDSLGQEGPHPQPQIRTQGPRQGWVPTPGEGRSSPPNSQSSQQRRPSPRTLSTAWPGLRGSACWMCQALKSSHFNQV